MIERVAEKPLPVKYIFRLSFMLAVVGLSHLQVSFVRSSPPLQVIMSNVCPGQTNLFCPKSCPWERWVFTLRGGQVEEWEKLNGNFTGVSNEKCKMVFDTTWITACGCRNTMRIAHHWHLNPADRLGSKTEMP